MDCVWDDVANKKGCRSNATAFQSSSKAPALCIQPLLRPVTVHHILINPIYAGAYALVAIILIPLISVITL